MIIFLNIMSLVNLELPLFIYFFLLFLFTVISSFIFLPYLGLYGVFFLNLISLFFFWISLLFYVNKIFIHQYTYNVFLFKWFFINYNCKININLLIDSVSFSFFFFNNNNRFVCIHICILLFQIRTFSRKVFIIYLFFYN